MRNSIAIKLGSIAITFLFLAGFSTTHGRIMEGRYLSPIDNFSVPVPKGIGQRLQDENDKNGGSVSFHDDFGSLRSIFYIRLSPATLKIQNDSEKQRANLKSFLGDYAMRWLIRPISPDASILHEGHLNMGNDNAYFALISIPSGSTLFDAKADKRHDTKRGVLIFVKNKFLYMLSSGENPSVFDLGKPAKSLDRLIKQEKKKLLSFKSEIIFK